MNESIQLGSLRFVSTAFGPHVAVRIFGALLSDDVPQSGYLITQTEWQSLLAIADTMAAQDKEIERLNAELRLERGGIDWKTLALDEEKERLNWKRIAEERHETLEQTRKELGELKQDRRVRIEIVRSPDNTGLRLIVNDKLISTGEYGGEPEDNCEYRDYSWVKEVIADCAKAFGAAVEIASVEVSPAIDDALIARNWTEVEKRQRQAYHEAMAKEPTSTGKKP